jgi:hypothetical protein
MHATANRSSALSDGVPVGTHLTSPQPGPDHVVVRVIDDGAPGEPAVLATAVVPLR